jgi:hypothetical protein
MTTLSAHKYSQAGEMEILQPGTWETSLKTFFGTVRKFRKTVPAPKGHGSWSHRASHSVGCLAGIILIQVLLTVTAEAQTILGFNVNGISESSSTTSFSATTISGNLSLATGLNALTRASGLTAESGSSMFNSTSWNTTNVFNESDDYISFSMQAQPGFEATYSSISYVLGASSTAPNTALWGYKIGGGSFVFQSSFTLQNSIYIGRASWDFLDFATTEVVEFRFWVYGAISTGLGSSTSAGTVRVRDLSTPTVNDLSVDGSLQAVPEPGTWGLLGIVAAFFLHRFSRNRSIASW